MSTTTIAVTLHVAVQARQQYAAETGRLLGDREEFPIDLSQLTPEQRETMLDCTGLRTRADLTTVLGPRGGVQVVAPVVPQSPDDWMAVCAAYRAVRDTVRAEAEQLAEQRAAQVAEQVAAAEARIADLEAAPLDQLVAARQERGDLGITLPQDGYLSASTSHPLAERLTALHARRQALYRRADQERARRAREEHEAREAAERAERARRAAEKSAWVAEHGSDFIKKAVAAGYDCQRRYVTERAALELPGFTVDFDDRADWRSRSCPSADALDRALALREAGHDATVVWLTTPPSDPTSDGYDVDDEPREAIVVAAYLGHYTLVS